MQWGIFICLTVIVGQLMAIAYILGAIRAQQPRTRVVRWGRKLR